METPGAATVEAVCQMLGVPPGAIVKAFPILVAERGPALVVIRGDHRLNEIKLRNALGADFRPAEAEEVRSAFGAEPGFIGPVGTPVDVLADEALRGLSGLVAGGNKPDVHLTGVEPGRDFEPTWVDVRRVETGDLCPAGQPIRIEPAIEVGNIFKLGTRYSEPLGARYLDEEGKEQLIWMGSYGIGPARIVAAAIEQFADEQGIRGRGRSRPSTWSWSRSASRGRRPARLPTGSTTTCATSGSTCSTTTAMPAPARSSRTPSCSAARCA